MLKIINVSRARILFVAMLLAATLTAVKLTDAAEQSNQDTIVADEEAGAAIYDAVCKGCHSVSIAPTLRGVIDRPIASVASFAGYTDALKAKQSLTWTEENLNTFLAGPTEFAPGTLMTQVVADAQSRADIIAFLATLPPPR